MPASLARESLAVQTKESNLGGKAGLLALRGELLCFRLSFIPLGKQKRSISFDSEPVWWVLERLNPDELLKRSIRGRSDFAF